MEKYRVYKTVVGRPRKDGGRIVKSYGCNGKQHVITYDLLWFDISGNASDGLSDVKPKKVVGKCNFNKECKNLGFFTVIDGEL